MADTNTKVAPKDANQTQEFSEEKEVLINVNRVTRVVKGGRRFRFQALLVVGNGDDMVGIGLGKAGDVPTAAAKAGKAARKNMKKIQLNYRNNSIPHEVIAKKSGAQILLKPASLGTGLIAGGTVRSVLSVTGITNVLSKSLGSSNKINCAYATVDALTQLVPEDQWQTRSSKKAATEVKAKKS